MTAAGLAFLLLFVLASGSAGASAAAYREGRLERACLFWTLVILSISVPFPTLTLHSHWAKVTWIPFSPPVRPFDIVANALLYLPWGLLLSANRSRPSVPLAAGLAALLSATIELIQVFSHMRFPSATDLVCNVAGAALGARACVALRARGQATARPSAEVGAMRVPLVKRP